MSTVTAVLIEQDRALAVELSEGGSIVGTGRGGGLREALDSLLPSSERIVAADARAAPVGAVVGVVDLISGQSASRALSLAGCAVTESVTINDHRTREARIQALITAKPEIVLMAGGTDNGDIHHFEELSNVVARAREELAPVLGYSPVLLFAGNPAALELVEKRLGVGIVHQASNVRPACEEENLEPAVAWAASLAPRLPIPEAAAIRPAGAARSTAVRDLALLFKKDVLLLSEDGLNSEVISMLSGNWNRSSVRDGTLEAAVKLHRAQARELSGVALMREISDAFGGHTPGRDLLDVAAPGIIVGAGPDIEKMPDTAAARRLIDLARPRGVTRLLRGSGDALSLLGLMTLLGEEVRLDSYHQILEDLALVVSIDGPGTRVVVNYQNEKLVVEAGEVLTIPIPVESEVQLDAQGGGAFGAEHGRRLTIDLPPLPAGLLIDTRGTPVPPERRVRLLPRR